MKIKEQYVVYVNGRFQILYLCPVKNDNPEFYITSNCSENEYYLCIEPCPRIEALKLLENIKNNI